MIRLRLVDRYISREFLRSLFVALGLIVLVVNMVDVWERMDTYLDRKAQPLEVVRFHLANLPFTIAIATPVAMLLGSIFSLGRLARRHELVALRTSGVPLPRVLAPVLALSLLSSIASLIFNETVVPWANRERDRINEQEIQGAAPSATGRRSDVAYIGSHGRMYQIREYNLKDQVMKRVTILEFDGDRLVRRLDAAEARWEGNQWVFRNGFQRVFDPQGREGASAFDRLVIPDLKEKPEDFQKVIDDPRLMGYVDLKREINRLRANGRDPRRYEVELGSRLALPFANFIVVLLGAPLAAANWQGGAARGFGLGLAVAFFYYGLLRLSQTIGQFTAVSPVLAPWLANAVFLLAGLLMLRRASRG